MKSILITGCNRGIGLGLVHHLLKSSNTATSNIFATCRNPQQAEELTSLAQKHSNLKILQLDVKNFDSYNDIVKQVQDVVKDGGLNLLVNNAGVSSKFTRVNLVKADQMTDNFLVNSVAPLMLTKAFIPLLKQASKANESLPLGCSRAAVINISSILGSIAENQQGGYYPYRCSKASLNAITRSLSFDLKEDKVLVVSIHPGWIKTDMGGKQAPLEIDQAVPQIIQLFSNISQSHNGGFYQYDGKQLPW